MTFGMKRLPHNFSVFLTIFTHKRFTELLQIVVIPHESLQFYYKSKRIVDIEKQL